MRCSGLSGIKLRYPGYITGRTALAFWGVSLEEDVPVEVATTVTDAERDGVLYVWMPDDMYFGFVVQKGLPAPVATPEKALVDGFWIEERWGIRACDPDDILWEMLDADALAEVLIRVGPDFIQHIPAGGGVRTAERVAFLRAVERRLGGHPPPRKPLPDEARMALEEILWDTPMTPEEFLDIAEGRRHHPRRAYWVARMLQLMDWARILDVCDVYAIADVWSEARKYIRSESLRRDLDDAFSEYRRRLHAEGPGEGPIGPGGEP